MRLKVDQKWVATAGIAVGGALTALASSDAVDPKIAGYAAIGVLILSVLGVYCAPNKKQEGEAFALGVTHGATLASIPKVEAKPQEPPAAIEPTGKPQPMPDAPAYMQPIQPPQANPYGLPWL